MKTKHAKERFFLLGLVVILMTGFTVIGCGSDSDGKNDDDDDGDKTKYTVTFYTEDGAAESYASVEVVSGKSISSAMPSNPSKSGFNFVGWYEGETRYSATKIIEKNVKLTARWEKNKVSKIFDFLESEKTRNNFTLPDGWGNLNPLLAGTITVREYWSNTTEATRKVSVYTPPDYDPAETYPILYLLHGIGGDHTEWVTGTPYYAEAGTPRLNAIVSNLISLGKAPPMIIVMPNVRARQQDSDLANNPTNVAAFYNFINDLRGDLMPFIEREYKVSDKREDRAIAGLSFGGVESLYISLNMPGTFGHLGVFSSPNFLFQHAHPNGTGEQRFTEAEAIYPEEYKEDTFILICCGTQDGTGITACRNYSKVFNDNGVRNYFYEVDGQHHFDFWNHALYYFVQCIFWQ